MAEGKSLKPKICVIGAGNVGSHLARVLAGAGNVCQILCRTREHAIPICNEIGNGCEAIDNPAKLAADADFYIIAVNDDSVGRIVDSTPDFPGIWAHTSGSVPASVFEGKKSRYGVFYPLQTFTRDVPVDITEVPFLIEGNTPEVTDRLLSLARTISRTVEKADSARRKVLHLAAVFACNFANLMWLEADDILRKEELSVRFFMPLLKATLGKLETISPADAMTGPARRGDEAVISAHCGMLDDEKRAIYKLLSDRIMEKFK